jgi:hypothetical protein
LSGQFRLTLDAPMSRSRHGPHIEGGVTLKIRQKRRFAKKVRVRIQMMKEDERAKVAVSTLGCLSFQLLPLKHQFTLVVLRGD